MSLATVAIIVCAVVFIGVIIYGAKQLAF